VYYLCHIVIFYSIYHFKDLSDGISFVANKPISESVLYKPRLEVVQPFEPNFGSIYYDPLLPMPKL
jgi:hypothetical protein